MSDKVYVVSVTSWNGEYDVTSVYQIFRDAAEAENFVTTANSNRNSSYSPSYEVDEWDIT